MGFIYAGIILLACILGAIVGLGGGVFIRPIFDAIGVHSVLNISFLSSSAILTMAIVSTYAKVKTGLEIDYKMAALISSGAVIGGTIGNIVLEHLIYIFYPHEYRVQQAQIIVTVIVLSISLIFTHKNYLRYELKNKFVLLPLGILLGSSAVFMGIGGGPVNVPVFMILFGLPIKKATAYSIIIIFFSHLSSIISILSTATPGYLDFPMLIFVFPAAALGGIIGAKFSNIFSSKVVKRLFMAAITGVILLNIFNGIFIL